MVAHVLTKLLPHGARLAEQLQRLAARTSINRTVAGVHFPVDSAAGQTLGQSLGEYFVGAGFGSKWKWHARTLVATDIDFLGDTLPPAGVKTEVSRPPNYDQSVVHWSWKAAKAEWS
jgi:hypothetical protein